MSADSSCAYTEADAHHGNQIARQGYPPGGRRTSFAVAAFVLALVGIYAPKQTSIHSKESRTPASSA